MVQLFVILNTKYEKDIPLVFNVKSLDDVKRKLLMVARQLSNMYNYNVSIYGRLFFKGKYFRFKGDRFHVIVEREKQKLITDFLSG